jgi:hypothetical protein
MGISCFYLPHQVCRNEHFSRTFCQYQLGFNAQIETHIRQLPKKQAQFTDATIITQMRAVSYLISLNVVTKEYSLLLPPVQAE